jgi:hypothetical protein
MSANNNNVVLIGGLVLAFMYMQRRQVMAVRPGTGAVASMPANVGTGWQQVATGAVAGFLQNLAKGPVNNTSQSYFPSTIDPLDAIRGGVVQEAVWPDDEMAGDWLF